jgi:hypothetical protein
MIWYNDKHDINKFTPAWMFPVRSSRLFAIARDQFMPQIFPMMLVGVVAFNTLRTMDPADPRSVGVLLVGYFFQGIGTSVTFCYICIYFLRIMMVRRPFFLSFLC